MKAFLSSVSVPSREETMPICASESWDAAGQAGDGAAGDAAQRQARATLIVWSPCSVPAVLVAASYWSRA